MTPLNKDIAPSAAPTEDEVRRWQALPRDEQLARMKALFGDNRTMSPGTLSMDQVRVRARAKIAERDNG